MDRQQTQTGTGTGTGTRTRIQAHGHRQTHTCTRVHAHAYMHTHTCTWVHAHTYIHTNTYLGKRASTGSFSTWARVNKSSRAGTPPASPSPLLADAGRVLSGERERARLSRERCWKCAIGSAASLCVCDRGGWVGGWASVLVAACC